MVTRRLLTQIVDNLVDLDQLWSRKAAIGIALTEAYFSRSQAVTVDSLAHRLAINDDTVRRALDQLVGAGKVELEVIRGRRSYRAAHIMAQQTMRILERAPDVRPQNAATAD